MTYTPLMLESTLNKLEPLPLDPHQDGVIDANSKNNSRISQLNDIRAIVDKVCLISLTSYEYLIFLAFSISFRAICHASPFVSNPLYGAFAELPTIGYKI